MLAGLVKGIVGLGLPTIGIGLGALISDIPTAMMLILVPTFSPIFFKFLAQARSAMFSRNPGFSSSGQSCWCR